MTPLVLMLYFGWAWCPRPDGVFPVSMFDYRDTPCVIQNNTLW